MSFTPEQAKKWLMVIGTAGAMISAGAGSTYSFLLSTGMIGGKLEKVNMILAEEHIGEEPTETTVVRNEPGDKQVVLNFANGDTLYYRKYENNDGKRQKLKRWTSKRSLDSIISTAMLDFDFRIVQTANASDAWIVGFLGEVYVGEDEDGNHVFYLPDEDLCEIHDPGTGEILETKEPPCDQYVVPGQKKG